MPSIDLIAILRSFLVVAGTIWTFLEAYSGLGAGNLSVPFWLFLSISLVGGTIFYAFDGLVLTGFLLSKARIQTPYGTQIEISFGDIFKKPGWIAIGVSDFFNSKVDERLISSKSLHGISIKKYWEGNESLWQNQVNNSLRNIESIIVHRDLGNKRKYPIGTTAVVQFENIKFLYFALAEANEQHITSNNAEGMIKSIRGMLKKARGYCSSDDLNLPLFGDGLARVELSKLVLIDLIITAIMEESRKGKVTDKINIVLLPSLKSKLNLKQIEKKWN